ncbi:hypothetical protein YYE_01337 [Plasmodium vinckei vinckei]|nr:hypothetical protein YYE_01337 [Plasmodium vinckei vinckei]
MNNKSIFKESIKQLEHNDYDEYLLMWLSDKLFKMYHESQGTNKRIAFVYRITLNQAYEEYLEKYKQRWDFWGLLNIQQGLKEANLKYMSEFYKLLNNICNTIVDYKDNGAESKNLSKNSIGCRRQYRILYNNISECQSYLDLLNKLKGIYDDFRSRAIKNTDSKNKLATNLKKLTPEDGDELEAVRGFKSYDFNRPKCKFPKKKKKIDSSKKAKSPGPQASSQASGSENKGNMESTKQSGQKNGSDISKGTDDGTGDPGSASGGGQDSKVGDSGSGTEGTSGDERNPNSENEKKNGGAKEPGDPSGGKGSQVNGDDRGNSEPGGADTEKSGAESGSADKVSETGDPSKGKGDLKGGTGDVSGGEQIDQGSSDGGTKDTKSVQGGQISNDNQGGANTSQQGTSGGSDHGTGNQGASSHQGGDTGDDKGSQEGSDGDKGSTDNNPLNGGGEQGGQDDQKSQDGSRDSESGPGSEQNPTPNDPSPPKKDSPQTPKAPQTSQNPKEQTNPVQSSQDPSGNKNSDKTDQQEAQKPVSNPVTKQENPGTELKGNGITGIDDGYVLKKYKKIVISIIVILIPITLTILYKVNKRKL